MTKDNDTLPLAPEDMEQNAREIFPTDMAPEEFAAKDGYGWLGFTFADYSYRDKALETWIHKVGHIIRSPELFKQCQQKYLTPAEQKRMQEYMDDDFED